MSDSEYPDIDIEKATIISLKAAPVDAHQTIADQDISVESWANSNRQRNEAILKGAEAAVKYAKNNPGENVYFKANGFSGLEALIPVDGVKTPDDLAGQAREALEAQGRGKLAKGFRGFP